MRSHLSRAPPLVHQHPETDCPAKQVKCASSKRSTCSVAVILLLRPVLCREVPAQTPDQTVVSTPKLQRMGRQEIDLRLQCWVVLQVQVRLDLLELPGNCLVLLVPPLVTPMPQVPQMPLVTPMPLVPPLIPQLVPSMLPVCSTVLPSERQAEHLARRTMPSQYLLGVSFPHHLRTSA